MAELERLRTRYLELLRERSLKIDRFTLTSGKTSAYYFDAKLTTLHPEGSYLGARLILETIRAEKLQIEAAEEAGFRIMAVFCLVDRQQGARERLRKYPFYPLVTADELLQDPEIQKQISRVESSAESGS